MKTLPLDELIAVHEARMRSKREPSRALPARAYMDPAQTVEYAAQIERKQLAKQKKKGSSERR